MVIEKLDGQFKIIIYHRSLQVSDCFESRTVVKSFISFNGQVVYCVRIFHSKMNESFVLGILSVAVQDEKAREGGNSEN